MGLMHSRIPAIVVRKGRSAGISVRSDLRLGVVRDPAKKAIMFAKGLVHANLIAVLVQVSGSRSRYNCCRLPQRDR